MSYLLDHGNKVMRCPVSGMYYDRMGADDLLSDGEVPDS